MEVNEFKKAIKVDEPSKLINKVLGKVKGLRLEHYQEWLHKDESTRCTARIISPVIMENSAMSLPDEQWEEFNEQCKRFSEELKNEIEKQYEERDRALRELGYSVRDLGFNWISNQQDSWIGIANRLNIVIVLQNTDDGFSFSMNENAR